MSNDAEWQDAAYTAARRIIRNRRHWCGMAEELLVLVVDKIGQPDDARRFGAVVKRLHTEGYLKRAGIGRARTSHRALKPRWKVAA